MIFDTCKGYGKKLQYNKMYLLNLKHFWVKLQVHNSIKVVFEVSNHKEYGKYLVLNF